MNISNDWIREAAGLFAADKPEHFTCYRHCDECAEHDETLRNATIEGIGLAELGNPGWDPVCFCSDEGKKHYMLAFIRLSLDTIDDECYLAQLLFHLQGDGPGNSLRLSCNPQQRQFIADFIAWLIDHYPQQLEQALCAEDALRVHQIWSEE